MSEYTWVKDSGVEKEENLLSAARQKTPEGQLFLAYCTDSFLAGHAEEKELAGIKPENLLELRIFSEKQELCFRRSFVGEVFQWRIASEKNVPESSYIVQYQTLDIDERRSYRENAPSGECGKQILCTTVGGRYSLPIRPGVNSAKVIAYVDYDNNGMGKITDYRLCSFLQIDVEKEKTEEGSRCI